MHTRPNFSNKKKDPNRKQNVNTELRQNKDLPVHLLGNRRNAFAEALGGGHMTFSLIFFLENK
jgi:hypothetical protein